MHKLYRSLILMLLLLVSLPLRAAEGDWPNFEVEVQTYSSGLTGFTGIYGNTLKDSSFGYYVSVHAASDRYHEIYVGPTYKPVDCVEIGIGLGHENEPNSTRRNAYFLAECGKVAAFVTYESGGSGPWHRFDLIYRLTEKFGAGIGGDTSFGHGPRFEYEIAKNVTLAAALFNDHVTKINTSMLSVAVKF